MRKEKVLEELREILIETETVRIAKDQFVSAALIAASKTISRIIMLTMLISTAVDAYHARYANIPYYFLVFIVTGIIGDWYITRKSNLVASQKAEIEEYADSVVKDYKTRSDERWSIDGTVINEIYEVNGETKQTSIDISEAIRIRNKEGNVIGVMLNGDNFIIFNSLESYIHYSPDYIIPDYNLTRRESPWL